MKKTSRISLGAGSALLCAFCLLPFLAGCDNGTTSSEDPVVKIDEGYFTDKRDGSKYKLIAVGSDIWMAENLRYADSSKSANLKGNMWCPDDDASKCKKFGPLYSWTAAKDISSDYQQKTYGKDLIHLQGICPEGFRLPSNSDWKYLARIVEKYRGDYAVAEYLKSSEGWESWSTDIQIYDPDWEGFNAMPAGRRNMEGGFLESGLFAFFWTGDEINEATASGWTLRDDNDVLDSGMYYKGHGMSIRCIVEDPDAVELEGELARFSFSYGSMEYDGQEYKTMEIGQNVWMAENLNYETPESRCYADKKENCKKYGRLYSREEAGTACPEGWKLPSNDDWLALIDEADRDARKLMATSDWFKNNGTNATGFSVLPSGIYDNGSFSDLTMSANFWVADQSDENKAAQTGYTFAYHSLSVVVGLYSANTYASIRCVKDKNSGL